MQAVEEVVRRDTVRHEIEELRTRVNELQNRIDQLESQL
jgi:uncharacterized protein YceH (UPF0502 family)